MTSVPNNPLRVLVAGASGFIGSQLVPALTGAGHQVSAMTRNAKSYRGGGTPIAGDVSDPVSLQRAMQNIDVAYYLVHTLEASDFEQRDAAGARNFGAAAAAAGVRQIVYLGGLGGDTDLSPHLRSRREVESLLGEAGVPVTVLRAAVVVGAGGVSWEMTRKLVQRLPVMAVPSWAATRTQPIALADAVRYLAGVAAASASFGKTYDIGGTSQLSYVDMLKTAARVIRGRSLPVLVVPMSKSPLIAVPLTWLSGLWMSSVSGVNRTTARNLIASMSTEVLVRDQAIAEIVAAEPMSYEQAVQVAAGSSSAQ